MSGEWSTAVREGLEAGGLDSDPGSTLTRCEGLRKPHLSVLQFFIYKTGLLLETTLQIAKHEGVKYL